MLDGSLYRFNPEAVKVVIHNNVETTPTGFAEEAADAIMRSLIEIAPDARPEFRGQFEAFKQQIHTMIFHTLEVRFKSAMNGTRLNTINGKDY